MTQSIFLDEGAEATAQAYAADDAHLVDELELADLRLARARHRLAGEDAATLDARVAITKTWIDDRVRATRSPVRIRAVADRLALADWELDAVLLLAAVEIDARRLVPFAVDGIPPPALTATKLWAALAEPAAELATWQRALFADGSLVARGIVSRGDHPAQVPQSAAPLRLAISAFGALTGAGHDDPVLDGIARRPPRWNVWQGSAEAERVAAALSKTGFALWISGSGADALALAESAAHATRREIRVIDVAALGRESPWARAKLEKALHLDQRLRDWVGVVDAHAVPPELVAEIRYLGDALAGPLIVVSAGDVAGLSEIAGAATRHVIARPDARERAQIWQRALDNTATELAAAQVAELADAFPMTAVEIEQVAFSVQSSHDPGSKPGLETYRIACAQRQSARLGRLADFVPHSFRWADLVLPAEERERLQEIIDRQRHRHTVFTLWNMAAKLPYGTGTATLFAGPPGTGKTMAASIVAAELARDLYRVDLSRIVDKYIGETEKNLARIFDAAADADAVLLFDEADSLFGKRTTVQSSNDRYANLETNYLLQRIEQHPGISILTTNHTQNIDEAFARRIPFRVEFPFPEPTARAEIWRRSFADGVPRGPIDFAALGKTYELAGGNIKSAVLRAIFMAARANKPVSHEYLARAAARELENMGKLA